MPALSMNHEVDPRDEILKRAGDLSSIEIFGSDVLLAVYERPKKTASGIILTDKYREEDRWQGKVHLILKIGPAAWLDENGDRFRDIEAGQWVILRPSDGQLVTINNMRRSAVSKDDALLCRIAQDISIRMRVDHPDQIW